MALTDLGEYAAAVDALSRAVKTEPNWAFALNELGIAYRKQGKYKEAADQFRKAISKDKKFAAAYYNLGEAEFKAGNISEARKAWEALKKMGRNDLAAQLDVATNGGLRGS
jgi:superkiller protein 3